MSTPHLTDEDSEFDGNEKPAYDDSGELVPTEFLTVEVRVMTKQEIQHRLERAGLTTQEINVLFAYIHTLDPTKDIES